MGCSSPCLHKILIQRKSQVHGVGNSTLEDGHQGTNLALCKICTERKLRKLKVKAHIECWLPWLMVKLAEVDRWRFLCELVKGLDERLTAHLGVILGLEVVNFI